MLLKIILQFLLRKIGARLIFKIMLKFLHIGPEYPTSKSLVINTASGVRIFTVQWGSENLASSDFVWLKVGWLWNGPIFEWFWTKWLPFDIRPSKCLVFKCFRYSNVRYWNPHCNCIRTCFN